MNKKIAVLVKIYKGDLNPFDECALECALSFDNADITVIAMSPLVYKETLESVTRLGCNAILISDPLYAGSDTIATSKVLAKALNKLNPDLIFCGRQSVDGDTGQVPSMISELLGYGLFNKVMDINHENVTLRNGNTVLIDKKQIFTFEKFKLLRSPSIFSKKKEITIWNNNDLNLLKEEVGQLGSPTKVIKSYQNNTDRRFCSFIEYKDLDEIINKSLINNNLEKERHINKAPLIHYIGNIKNIAEKYGEKSQEIDVENLSVSDICQKIKELKPHIIFWEENEKYKPLAARVAISLNIGLCADCTDFDNKDGKFVITRPALGGDIFADIICDSAISMATVRNVSEQKENVAITVGRGAIKYLDKIQRLADRYNAKIYCSRPIADEGLLDYSKQVGLTGIVINPKVCITIGTSGAVQHMVGINKSQTIIAININKKEKVFDFANYGIIMDAMNI